jgi:hypothetical protein
MAGLLYGLGSWISAAGLLSAMFCFVVFYGRVIFGSGVVVRGETTIQVYEYPAFNYGWLKWSLAAFFCGSVVAKTVLIFHPEFAAGDGPELSGTPSEAGRIAGEFLSVLFVALLGMGAVLLADAIQRPERGLGRYWPLVSRFFFRAHQFAEGRCAEREEAQWPSYITIGSND